MIIGSWLLVQCFQSKPKRSNKTKKVKSEPNETITTSSKKRKRATDEKPPETPPIAAKPGYVIFKDKKCDLLLQ